ncbi:UNVERIFIED_CONTAM: hypothetical protein Slati_0026300 [Sesamum latifolium]|uniref:Uncharacterized protein n=1 Tax=Sesamum latifolium TaxID=2727402 RepID=A0AAW2Y6D2_9LAMI
MDDLKVAKKEAVARYQKAEKEVKRVQREVNALQEEYAEELWAQADQVRKKFPETEEGKNLLEACWASKQVALVAGPFLRFAFEACRQQFLAQGYPPTGEDTSFLNFEAVLHSVPNLLSSQSQLLNLLLRNQVLRLCYSVWFPLILAWVFILEGDLDRLVGETEAEVRDAPGQMGSGVVAEKAFEEEPPQPMNDDAAGPSKESQAQEDDAQVEENAPSVG